MATELEIITHVNTQRAFNEALKKALLVDPEMVKALGLPAFTTDCKIEVAFAIKMARDWDTDSTAAEIIFSLTGVICSRIINAEGSAKLKGLMVGWSELLADYAVGMPQFENMKVCAKVIA